MPSRRLFDGAQTELGILPIVAVAIGPLLFVYTGTAWQQVSNAGFRYWSGTAFSSATRVSYWDGTAWSSNLIQ